MALIRWQQPSTSGKSIVATGSGLFADLPVTDEEMISVWQRLIAVLPNRQRITLGVIAAASGAGVSTVVRGLARVVAKNPSTRILICELFRSAEPARIDTDAEPSLVDFVFSERIERSNTVQWLAGDRVALGSLGDAQWLNAISTDHESVRSIVAALSAHFEVVLVDLPPMSTSIASPAFARVLDGVVLVVEAERTPAHAVRAAHEALSVHGGNVLGVVLNKRKAHAQGVIRRGLELIKAGR